MATGSSVAQYFPSRYSRTKTGTLAPTLTLRTRSLRTTLPAKIDVAFWSNSGMASSSDSNGDLDLVQARELRTAGGIEERDAHGLLRDLLDPHHGHRVRFNPL